MGEAEGTASVTVSQTYQRVRQAVLLTHSGILDDDLTWTILSVRICKMRMTGSYFRGGYHGFTVRVYVRINSIQYNARHVAST